MINNNFQPFTYAVCLNELGNEIVHQYVGQVSLGCSHITAAKIRGSWTPLVRNGQLLAYPHHHITPSFGG